MNFLKMLWKAIDVFLAMSGLRLDSGRMLFAWIPLLGLSTGLLYYVDQNGYHIPYIICTWIFYYLGISLILGTNIKRVMAQKFGEDKALAFYDMICGLMFFNIGTGKGHSVLEVVKAFEAISGIKLNYVFKERRAGDIVSAFADTTKANNILGWKSELSLNDALASSWKWEKKIRK